MSVTELAVDQVWELAASMGGWYRVRIVKLTDKSAVCLTKRGKRYVLPRKVLNGGTSRPARLVEPGMKGVQQATKGVKRLQPDRKEERTASDLVRDVAPKGIVKANSDDNEILRLFEREQMDANAIAAKFKIAPKHVHNRLKRARLAREDARILKAMRDA